MPCALGRTSWTNRSSLDLFSLSINGRALLPFLLGGVSKISLLTRPQLAESNRVKELGYTPRPQREPLPAPGWAGDAGFFLTLRAGPSLLTTSAWCPPKSCQCQHSPLLTPSHPTQPTQPAPLRVTTSPTSSQSGASGELMSGGCGGVPPLPKSHYLKCHRP